MGKILANMPAVFGTIIEHPSGHIMQIMEFHVFTIINSMLINYKHQLAYCKYIHGIAMTFVPARNLADQAKRLRKSMCSGPAIGMGGACGC